MAKKNSGANPPENFEEVSSPEVEAAGAAAKAKREAQIAKLKDEGFTLGQALTGESKPAKKGAKGKKTTRVSRDPLKVSLENNPLSQPSKSTKESSYIDVDNPVAENKPTVSPSLVERTLGNQGAPAPRGAATEAWLNIIKENMPSPDSLSSLKAWEANDAFDKAKIKEATSDAYEARDGMEDLPKMGDAEKSNEPQKRSDNPRDTGYTPWLKAEDQPEEWARGISQGYTLRENPEKNAPREAPKESPRNIMREVNGVTKPITAHLADIKAYVDYAHQKHMMANGLARQAGIKNAVVVLMQKSGHNVLGRTGGASGVHMCGNAECQNNQGLAVLGSQSANEAVKNLSDVFYIHHIANNPKNVKFINDYADRYAHEQGVGYDHNLSREEQHLSSKGSHWHEPILPDENGNMPLKVEETGELDENGNKKTRQVPLSAADQARYSSPAKWDAVMNTPGVKHILNVISIVRHANTLRDAGVINSDDYPNIGSDETLKPGRVVLGERKVDSGRVNKKGDPIYRTTKGGTLTPADTAGFGMHFSFGDVHKWVASLRGRSSGRGAVKSAGPSFAAGLLKTDLHMSPRDAVAGLSGLMTKAAVETENMPKDIEEATRQIKAANPDKAVASQKIDEMRQRARTRVMGNEVLATKIAKSFFKHTDSVRELLGQRREAAGIAGAAARWKDKTIAEPLRLDAPHDERMEGVQPGSKETRQNQDSTMSNSGIAADILNAGKAVAQASGTEVEEPRTLTEDLVDKRQKGLKELSRGTKSSRRVRVPGTSSGVPESIPTGQKRFPEGSSQGMQPAVPELSHAHRRELAQANQQNRMMMAVHSGRVENFVKSHQSSPSIQAANPSASYHDILYTLADRGDMGASRLVEEHQNLLENHQKNVDAIARRHTNSDYTSE